MSLQQNVKNHSYPEKSCRSQKCLVWSQNQWFLFSKVIFVSKFFSISKIFIYGGYRQVGNEEAEDKFGKTDSIWTENPDINTNSFTKCKRPVQHDFFVWTNYFLAHLLPLQILNIEANMDNDDDEIHAIFIFWHQWCKAKKNSNGFYMIFPISNSVWPDRQEISLKNFLTCPWNGPTKISH